MGVSEDPNPKPYIQSHKSQYMGVWEDSWEDIEDEAARVGLSLMISSRVPAT